MRTFIKGVGFDSVTLDEAQDRALALLSAPGGHYVVTPNPEIVMLAQRDAAFREALNGADLVIPDGIGVVYAARILGRPLKARVPGIELGERLLAAAAAAEKGVYLLGAKPGVAQRAAERLAERYPGLRVVGTGDGYFQEDGPVLERIQAAKPALLLVCLSFPRQELWMAAHRDQVGDALMLGLGGALDVFAGDVKRAPAFWCRVGLEWFYRLLSQPSRIKRMIKLPVILVSAAWERITHGKADCV